MSKIKLYIAVISYIAAPTLSTILLMVWDNNYSLFASCILSGICGLIGTTLMIDFLTEHAYTNYLKGYEAGQADSATDVRNVLFNNKH